MGKYIGRQISVWFGRETTRGTAVAISKWVPKTDFSFEEKAEIIQDESSIGVLTDSRDWFVSKQRAEGELSSSIEVNSIGWLLYSLLGSVSVTTATTGAYKHTFSLLETNQAPSLTTAIKDPVLGTLAFPLTMVDEFTITCEEWQFAMFTVKLKSKPGAVAVDTVTYVADYKLLSRHSIFKTAANLAGLSGASAVCLRSFEITFTKNLEDDYCLGGLSPIDFINKQFIIEGSFTAVFTDTTYRAFQLAWSKKAISFELKDTGTTIGLSSNPGLLIKLPIASFTEFSRTQGNDELVLQTLAFKWLQSIADGKSVEVELVNTTASYTA